MKYVFFFPFQKIMLKQQNTYPPVLQILETKFFRNRSSTKYKIFLSDGEMGIFFRTSVQLNKLHSTGQLSVLTVIRIDQYSDEIPDVDSDDNEPFIVHLTVLVNGRDMKKVFGAPVNVSSDLQDWLKWFTKKLEFEKKMKEKAEKFNLNCINSPKNISKLTQGSLEKICFREIVDKPIVQILSLVKIINAEENLIYYTVHLSDGKSCFNRVFTQSFHFNNLVEAGIISKFAIIRLDRYKLFEYNTRIRIYNLTVMNKGTDVKKKIGNTLPIKLPGISDIMLDRMKDNISLDQKTCPLSLASLSDIQREVPWTNPVLQIIILNRYGTQYGVQISDGVFKISTEVMNDDISRKILSAKQPSHAIIRLDEYEVAFVKESFEFYRPVLHIIKATLIGDSSGLNQKIGKPICSESNKSMSEEEGPDYVFEIIEEEQIEQPASASASTSVEKPIFNKGFLCKDSIVEESSSQEYSNEMAEKHKNLNEKIRDLTLQVEECTKYESDCKNDISKLQMANDKIKKRLGKIHKKGLKVSQKVLENNLEIIGVELKPNENLKAILIKIFGIVSVTLDIDIDIVSINRSVRNTSILVQCRNIDIKQKILDAKRGKELDPELILNLPNPLKRKIFITEQLAPFNKVLLIRAKALKNDKVFDFVWIKNGKLLVQSATKNENKPIHIYSMDQILKYSSK